VKVCRHISRICKTILWSRRMSNSSPFGFIGRSYDGNPPHYDRLGVPYTCRGYTVVQVRRAYTYRWYTVVF
jgi:hypothetical protein